MNEIPNEQIFIKFSSFGILKNILHQTKYLKQAILNLKNMAIKKLPEYEEKPVTASNENYNANYTLLERIKETINNLDIANKNFTTKVDKYMDTLDKYDLELDEFSKKINNTKLDYGLQGQLKSTFRKLPSKPTMDKLQEEMYDELMSNPDVKVGTNGRGGRKRSYRKRRTNKRRSNKRKSNKRKRTHKKY